MLIGTYHHQLDQKNRFRIPAKFKSKLGEDIVITKGTNHSLYLLSSTEIKESVLDKMHTVSMFDEEVQRSFRLLLSSSHELEQDAQGRSLLPAALKTFASITKNIVFVGVGNRVEIWAEEKWQNYAHGVDFDKELDGLKKSGV